MSHLRLNSLFQSVLVIICFATTSTQNESSHMLNFVENYLEDKWDHFIFTQQWPPSVCVNEAEHICKISNNVTTWTVHGLWPNDGIELKPCYCNSTWKFNPAKIMPIFDQLLEFWPNLFYTTPSTEYEFWKHEWEKHGTCAASKPELDTEFKYFQMGLSLRKRIDLASAFKEKAITPSNSTEYKVADVEMALTNLLGNGSFKIECEYFGEPKKQYLKQIEVCLTKDSYKPMTCPTKHSSSTLIASSSGAASKSCKFATAAEAHAGKAAQWQKENPQQDKSPRFSGDGVGRCAGDPNYCKCLDTLMIPEYYHK